jgi:hypothetical protein
MWVTVLMVGHVLVGAAWLGATWYSFAVLHRRGPACFDEDRDFERFITAISDGNRQRIFGAAAWLAASGAALIWLLRAQVRGELWWWLVAGKAALMVATLAIVSTISWRMWPARIFALEHELPALRATQTRLRAAMVLMLGLGCALGVIAHATRSG